LQFWWCNSCKEKKENNQMYMMAIDGPWMKRQNYSKCPFLCKRKLFFPLKKSRDEIDETKFTISLSTVNCWFSIECFINHCF
jgi:hypothetical protein